MRSLFNHRHLEADPIIDKMYPEAGIHDKINTLQEEESKMLRICDTMCFRIRGIMEFIQR